MITSSLQSRMKSLFTEGFIALDIAEPLISFDADRDSKTIRKFMEERKLRVVGLRVDGTVSGFARRADLTDGTCLDHLHPLNERQILPETASFSEVIELLTSSNWCFVSILGTVGAIVTRTDIQKPPVRMWLFGMISIIEMSMMRAIEERYGPEGWQRKISPQRLRKARELQEERYRRNQETDLIDCLQLSDKAFILLKDPEARAEMGFESRRQGEQALKQLESLRNNLAHAQDIVTYNWEGIVKISRRLDRIISRL